jgi:putative transposase
MWGRHSWRRAGFQAGLRFFGHTAHYYRVAFYERRLPHWHPTGRDLFITWRLYGTLPPNRFVPPEGLTSGQAFASIDRYLDRAAYGPSCLRTPEIAQSVASALHHTQDELRRYVLHAYIVMPNHVHVLISAARPVAAIMQSLKGDTAREANRMLDRTGQPFWQRESYDHWVREGEFERIARYIEWNPVIAGLANEPHLYPWSSAARREAGQKAGSPA